MSTISYKDFLASKTRRIEPAGTAITPGEVHPRLHPFQSDIVRWAVARGRAAIWTTTGTGKTTMMLEWCRLSGATSLIVTPLAVAQQTVRESVLLDIEARYIRDGSEITGPGVWVTNYEMIDRIDPARLDAVVLDESSIIVGRRGGGARQPPGHVGEVLDKPGPGLAGGVLHRSRARKLTLADRCARAAELVAAEPDEPWLLWTGLNAEAELLAELIPGAVNVHGSMSPEEKAEKLLGFADGRYRVLVTKPGLAGHGMNFQRCARMAFVGLSDSWEQYFQAIRRCYRYGQTRVVQAHIVLSALEQEVADNVNRKEEQATEMIADLVAEMRAARQEQAA